MAKVKTVFMCQECGYETAKWMGKCPACNEWNSFVEQREEKSSGKSSRKSSVYASPVDISSVEIIEEDRGNTGMKELDRVLGGGIVKGSLILIGGDPGIGKSTLLLQISKEVSKDSNLMYVSGEESSKQIKMRAERLGVDKSKIMLMCETDIGVVSECILEHKSDVVIIDSVQTMFSDDITSAPGSVSQVREVTGILMNLAKQNGITIMIVGHVTKDGAIAGPRVLEHMVDTVLYFEGDRHLNYRILRAVKNRFGSTNEIGIFEMKDTGLVEVDNPSAMMLEGRPEGVPGSFVIPTMEGTRPMLIEVQALVTPTVFGMPRRMATGIDYNRVTILMAVLEKRLGYTMSSYDAYVNIVGGLKVDEPACDLGTVMAIASSYKNIAVDNKIVAVGEVGLTGEIRSVSQIENRIKEAIRLGFKKAIIPESNYNMIKAVKGMQDILLIPVKYVDKAINVLENMRN